MQLHYTEQGFNLEYLLGETSRLYCRPTCSCNQRSLPPGEGLPYERGGMLVVSFRVAREEMYKNYTLSIRFIHSIHAIQIYNCLFQGKKKKGWATLGLTFTQLQGFHSILRRASPRISYGVPSRVHCSTRQTPFSVNSSSC